jgi:flagellar basal body-associated protein FliL
MLPWIILGIVLAVLTTGITLVWWWVGDQWANEEYKKFGHGGGAKRSEHTKVIKDAEMNESAVIEEPVNE